MARYSAAKIIVRYHIGEPNEVTSDVAALAYFNGISASDPATSGFFVLCDAAAQSKATRIRRGSAVRG
jgi:hypothetical protein